MITGAGKLDDFIRVIKNLTDDQQHIVKWNLYEHNVNLSSLRKQNISSILEGSRVTADRCRVMRGGESLESSVYREGKDKHGVKRSFLQTKLLNNVLKKGATIAFDSINEFPNFSKALCERLRFEFNARSNANLYYSNTSLSGFGGHRDDHDFIAVQIEGSKNWNIEDICGERRDISETEPTSLSQCVTNPGDMLYVPKGFWHNPMCSTDTSIHVTCSIVRPQIEDFTYWVENVCEISFDNKNKLDSESNDYLEIKRMFGEYWNTTIEKDAHPSIDL